MGCRKEEEDRFWGRLGSEAGKSQAAPVLIWRYRLTGCDPCKKETSHAADYPCFPPRKKASQLHRADNNLSTPTISCSQWKQPKISHLSATFPQIIDHVNPPDSLKVFWHKVSCCQWSATSSGVCFARNAAFLAEPNINQTSPQGEVNGEDLQQQGKKSMKVYIQLFSGFKVSFFFKLD